MGNSKRRHAIIRKIFDIITVLGGLMFVINLVVLAILGSAENVFSLGYLKAVLIVIVADVGYVLWIKFCNAVGYNIHESN